MVSNGIMITAMGIPGSGKSSILRCLANMNNAKLYCEPEETQWPEAVSNRSIYGYFSSITWFRSMRVPQLYKARSDADGGRISFVDSYYDKLLYNYIGKSGLDWFLPRNDQYFDLVFKMAELDYSTLPNADVIIFFNISPITWSSLLNIRNRNMDNEELFKSQCFSSQEPMLKATEKYAKDFNKQFIVIEQEFGTPENIAQKTQKELEKHL